MPLDSRVWVTLADLKEHLDISDTDKDSFLTNILNAAWEMAKNYIGYDLNDTVYTEDYDGDGTNELLLKKWPIISITSIKDDTDRTFGSDTVIDSTDYLFDADTGLVTLFQGQGVFTSGRGNIRVVYTAGYTSIPYDAQRGLIMLASWLAARAGTEAMIAQTLGGKSEQYENYNIPLYIRQCFAPYKNYSV